MEEYVLELEQKAYQTHATWKELCITFRSGELQLLRPSRHLRRGRRLRRTSTYITQNQDNCNSKHNSWTTPKRHSHTIERHNLLQLLHPTTHSIPPKLNYYNNEVPCFTSTRLSTPWKAVQNDLEGEQTQEKLQEITNTNFGSGPGELVGQIEREGGQWVDGGQQQLIKWWRGGRLIGGGSGWQEVSKVPPLVSKASPFVLFGTLGECAQWPFWWQDGAHHHFPSPLAVRV